MIKIEFKDGVNDKEILLLTSLMSALLLKFAMEAAIRGQNITITSIRDRAQNRISKSHAEGRAVDIRSRDFTIDPKQFCDEFNETYERQFGFIDGKPVQKPCVYHDNGGGWHFHLQSLK